MIVERTRKNHKKKQNKTQVKDLWNEEWRKLVPKAATKKKDYYFSNYGRLKSIHKVTDSEQLLKGSANPDGFVTLNIHLIDNLREGFYLHQLVAKAFLCPPQADQRFVAHIDGNKRNNFYKNLKWVNREELTAIRIRSGVYGPSKAREQRAVLSIRKVKEIKKHLRDGTMTQVAMAQKYGVSNVSIQKIKRGETWQYVVLSDND